jgi:two-component system sensor histidine kinase HydH
MNFLPRSSLATGPDAPRRLNLSRWFALAALTSIGVLAASIGVLLNNFVTHRMVIQEASLTQEFVNSLLLVETPLLDFIADPSRRGEAEMSESFAHLSRMPDVLRANLYDRGQKLIWSTDANMIGRVFDHNPELERALAGELVAEDGAHSNDDEGKGEHHMLPGRNELFVEIYVPVQDAAKSGVIGVIEFYKRPRTLARSLAELRLYMALGALLGGGLLFLALYGLVRRADITIREQERLLVDQAKLAALGEMSGVVAHGIRNPLASIRSSAELMQESPPEEARGAAEDIVAQADRLEAWVRELLSYTQPLDAAATPVALEPVVRTCFEHFAREFERRHIEAHQQFPNDLPAVRGDPLLLSQVMHTLVANAVEVLPGGGRIDVRGQGERRGGRGTVLLEVVDNGPGLSPAQLARVGQPFYTTKPRGLGVGLAMARRVVERAGGRLEIHSAPGRGTAIRLYLAAA